MQKQSGWLAEPAVRLNRGVLGLRPSATVAINDRSNQLRREGRAIFKLGLGQSPFPVPDVVVEALRTHAAEKDYLPSRGLSALREAVASWHRRVDGIAASADDVLIGPGSKELMFLLQMSLEAELLLPSPSWVSYEPQARILGRQVTWLQTRARDGWRLDPATLDRHGREGGGCRILVLNAPGNPSGTTYDVDHLAALAAVARRHGLLILSDEIYGALHHQGRHVSMAHFHPEGTIVSSGLSKWCGAGGWRLGTFHLPPSLHSIRDTIAALATETFTSTSAPIQHAAIRAFEGGEAIESYLDDSRRILQVLGQRVATTLRARGVEVADPEGGFYLFPDLGAFGERLLARGIRGARALCERLLEETGVAVLPGVEFGRPEGELTFRLAYVDFDGAAALEAAAGGAPIDEAFLRAHCGRVIEAAERIVAFL